MDHNVSSSSVKIDNISDYIGSSADCIFEEEILEKRTKNDPIKVRINKRNGGHFDQIRTNEKAAKVTLDDCLACSGCITSAETVLVAQQSTEYFLRITSSLEENQKLVVTLSPQSIISLAERFSLSYTSTFRKLTTFFKQKHFAFHVFDATLGNIVSLKLSLSEFLTREKRPIFASECPGWICYAEKKLGAQVLPFLSKVKSPQAVMGRLVKKLVSKDCGCDAKNVVHVTVMPCYDKKLEAARKNDDDFEDCEVDCVLATSELLVLLSDCDFSTFPETKDKITENSLSDKIIGHKLNSFPFSGGYIQNIIDFYAPHTQEVIRNKDEITLKTERGEIRLLYAYGFQNISKITRKLQYVNEKVDFVEIMACTSGCLNGGGQISSKNRSIRERKQHVKRLEKRFDDLPVLRDDFRREVEVWASRLGDEELLTSFADKKKGSLNDW